MINPTPVTATTSPYGQQPGGRPKPVPALGRKRRFTWRRLFAMSLVLLVAASGTYAYAYYSGIKDAVIVRHQGGNSSALSLYAKNSSDTSGLKQAGDGRFNMLILGIGGENHPGGQLTDTIQVMSLDTVNKRLSLTSIPRDLYVNVPGYGYSKINATYGIGEQRAAGNGGYLLRQVVGTVLGINVSNYILVDFSGAKDLVNQLGGVDVDVPKAIVDPLFPCDDTVKYCPFSISAGLHHMDGDTALKYARSRETTSDFDRSARQQLVIAAMKKKALSLGTLSNPAKILGLITTLGQHVRTDLDTDEIKSFFSAYREVAASDSSSQVLDTSASLGLLTASSGTSAGYISYPVLGKGKYSAIHDWFQKNDPDPYLAKEAPTVTVVAGRSATAKQVAAVVASLNDYGFTATAGTTASTGTAATTVYAAGSDKPVSSSYLGSYFSVDPVGGHSLASGSDFEVVYVPSAQ